MALAESQIVISKAEVKLGGDFRYRHEMIDDATKDEARNRQRFRLRLSIDAGITDDMSIIGRIATGSATATSTNQTADGAFSSKASWIDLAYAKWNPSFMKSATIQAGKMKNPFVRVGKSQLVWDGDVNPEGASLALKAKHSGVELGARGGYFWIDELKSSEYDVTMLGGQGYIGLKGAPGKLTIGASVYDFKNVVESPALTDDGFSGNMSFNLGAGDDAQEVYLNPYTLTNYFVEFKAKTLPVTLHYDMVRNVDAPDGDNTGWLIGGSIGSGKGEMPVKLAYFYRDVQRDAVVASFSDSDFAGGGTDNKGHVIKASLGINKQSKLSATYFSNTKGASTDETAYDRAQVDFNVKF